jgi:hypothetical protein
MPLHRTIPVVCLLALASPAAGQTWREAHAAGNHAAAASLLHEAVLEPPESGEPDFEAAEALATLYAEGLGVQQDSVLGCAILRAASAEAAGRQHVAAARLTVASLSRCTTLTPKARAEADAMAGCYAFEVPFETFNLGPGHRVQSTRRGLRVIDGDRTSERAIEVPGCHRQLALIRYAPVLTPSAEQALAARHFFELFHWTSHRRDGRAVRVLSWTLVEIAGSNLETLEHEVLLETSAAAWPPMHPAAPLPRTVFTAAADGGVTWRFDPAPHRSGTLAAAR